MFPAYKKNGFISKEEISRIENAEDIKSIIVPNEILKSILKMKLELRNVSGNSVAPSER